MVCPSCLAMRTILQARLFAHNLIDGISCCQEVNVKKGFLEKSCVTDKNACSPKIRPAGSPSCRSDATGRRPAGARSKEQGAGLSPSRLRAIPPEPAEPLLSPRVRRLHAVSIILPWSRPCPGGLWTHGGSTDTAQCK